MKKFNIILTLTLSFLLASCSVPQVPAPKPLPQAGRLPLEGHQDWYVNYVNVVYQCGTQERVFAVTVNHMAYAITAVPIVKDEKADIAVYEYLGYAPPYRLGSMPALTDHVLVAGQLMKTDFYYQGYLAGFFLYEGIMWPALQTIGYQGMSGSPVFNDNGEFVGSVTMISEQFGGVTLITRVDRIKELLDQACQVSLADCMIDCFGYDLTEFTQTMPLPRQVRH